MVRSVASTMLIFFLVVPAVAISDLNCTDNGAYNTLATACSNVYSDAACNTVYFNSTVMPGGTEERPTECFNGTNGPSEDIKAMATASCPRTCGYCCRTEEYSCSNAPYPRIQCSTVTSRMCQDVAWRSVIATDCPSVCGFCKEGGCIDVAPDCHTQPTVCVAKGLEQFVATNCQRTCGLCTSGGSTLSPGVTSGACGDSSRACQSWVKNGFCNSSHYTAQQKRQYCGATCGLCGGK